MIKTRFLDWYFIFHYIGIAVFLYFGWIVNDLFFAQPNIVTMLVSSLVFLGTVIMHEFAHGYAARWLGYRVNQIHINAMGGAVYIPEPRTEAHDLFITGAGPISNFVMAALGFFVFIPLLIHSGLNLEVNFGLFLTNLTMMVISVNIILGCFNLIPAFPMDGGRIFRSTLALFIRRDKAYQIGFKVGMVLGILIGIYGLIHFAPITVLIAALIVYVNYQGIDART